jgi:murein DD-endopeptidase MepM/ murein hydrolase activator NlpD
MLEGNLIIIDHGRGLFSAMMHLSKLEVKPGDIVAQGQVIGRIGSTGRSTGPHLHWGMTWHGVKVDPEALLPPMPAKDATGR